MPEKISIGLALVVGLGALAQWTAWRLRIPAILLLLSAGILAGPITGILDPDQILGELLLPIVSIAVALILFEGGLSLDLHEITGLKRSLMSLVSLGAGLSWLGAALAARVVVGLDWSLAMLLGAILTVTGPTVVGPLLRHIRPSGPAAPILKWEGIVIDPIGAMLALLVFNVLEASGREAAFLSTITAIGLTLVVGLLGGFLAARGLHLLLRRHWLPDFLQNPTILGLVVVSFVASNWVQKESGLLTVTVMGAVLANQRSVALRHIVEFKENLRVLLISGIFVLLAARIDLRSLLELGWRGPTFIAALALLVRPISVFGATVLAKGLSNKDRLLMAWMAPRGVVAAAVASIFALELEERGVTEAARLIPVTFSVIIGTVLLYGSTGGWLARGLGLAGGPSEGILFVGAPDWAIELAVLLKDRGFRSVLVDTNRAQVRKARLLGLEARQADALSETLLESLDYAGLGRMFAVTPSNEINRLAAHHFREVFGREQLYRLSPYGLKDQDQNAPAQVEDGRLLFDKDMGTAYLAARFASGSRLKATRLSTTFGFEAWRERTGHGARALLVIRGERIVVGTADSPLEPRADDLLVGLIPVDHDDETTTGAQRIAAGDRSARPQVEHDA
ncbi:MAG: sodium:proton antiporter [Planctomycetes bacterium]|nr:sodium:proton antiporter [Planctomycetota bacterium]